MNVEPALRDQLLAAIPNLRAYAYSFTYNWDRADDFVQDALVRAWGKLDQFEPGTNLHAWLFTILRNAVYSEKRKRKREVEDPDGAYAARLRTHADQQSHLDFEDFRTALARLNAGQREALLLVGAEGLSYEEAAQVCGVPLGTLKSRVNRARERLVELLEVTALEDIGPDRTGSHVLLCSGKAERRDGKAPLDRRSGCGGHPVTACDVCCLSGSEGAPR